MRHSRGPVCGMSPETERRGRWRSARAETSVARADYARVLGIRFERESDRPSIRALHLAAFGDRGNVVVDLVDDLRSAVAKGEGLSLVAEERGEVVGHAMFTPSWLDTRRRLVDVQVLSPVG
jgi:hypothetical protein